MELKTGWVVNGCQLVQRMGNGGFGQVWKAIDQTLNCPVALKFIPQRIAKYSEEQTERHAVREAQLRAKLRYRAHIPLVHRFEPYKCEEARAAFGWTLVMEYIDGTDLVDKLVQIRRDCCGELSDVLGHVSAHGFEGASAKIDYERFTGAHLLTIVDWCISVAETIKEVHSEDVIHLDIKPQNIRIHNNGELVYVTDLGIGRFRGTDGIFGSGLPAWSDPYAPPEQILRQERDLDAVSDVFALGATLYHALCLFWPYATIENGLINSLSREEDPSAKPIRLRDINRSLDPQLCDIVEKAMAPAKADRYQSMDELLNALNEWRHVQADAAVQYRDPGAATAVDTLSEVLKDRAKYNEGKAGLLIPYDVVHSNQLPDDQFLKLVQLGVLRMEPQGYRFPTLAKGPAHDFSARNEVEWREKLAIGHLASLLLTSPPHRGVVAVDAGSTTLWVLRALIYRELAGSDVPGEVFTNSLMGLAETINVSGESRWFPLGGQKDGRTNAFVDGVVDNMPAGLQFDTVVLGVNSLTSRGVLATTSGNEGPIKQELIKRCLREVLLVINPMKLGAPGNKPLSLEHNLAALLTDQNLTVTVVTALPFRMSATSAVAHATRVRSFHEVLGGLLSWWPVRKPELSLYGVPVSPRNMKDIATLDDLPADHQQSSGGINLRECCVEFRRGLSEEMVGCLTLKHVPY